MTLPRFHFPFGWLASGALCVVLSPLANACTASRDAVEVAPAAGSGGTAGTAEAGSAGQGGDTAPGAGMGANSGAAGEGDPFPGGSPGTPGQSGAPGQGGAPNTNPDPNFSELLERGQSSISEQPRPAYGALLAVNDGERSYVVESRRDVEPGPFQIPWRSRFRLAAYDAGVETWAYTAEPDDLIGDVAVHPSGDITLSLQRQSPDRQAYELVRLTRDGALISSTELEEPRTIPESDFAPSDPRPLFRMKAESVDATTAGWVRLLADGEGLAVALLSFVDVPSSRKLALGLATFDWSSTGYIERWARVVEGTHVAEPATWTYDELRWNEQAIRPFFARDETTGELLVGRAWNSTRCRANVAAFAEFSAADCFSTAVGAAENERLPLAVTRFDSTGVRTGTRILVPDADAAEQVPFALAARGGELTVVGSVVRSLAGGAKRTYPDANGYVDYDGYIGSYDAEGQLLRVHDFNLGRGDVLTALRWTAGGIVAVGASGWDRWQGGMSISRGADPLFVWLSPDGHTSAERVISLTDGTRHFNLHDLVILNGAVTGYGFSDAPMTHSGDGNNTGARTFGPLRIRLSSAE